MNSAIAGKTINQVAFHEMGYHMINGPSNVETQLGSDVFWGGSHENFCHDLSRYDRPGSGCDNMKKWPLDHVLYDGYVELEVEVSIIHIHFFHNISHIHVIPAQVGFIIYPIKISQYTLIYPYVYNISHIHEVWPISNPTFFSHGILGSDHRWPGAWPGACPGSSATVDDMDRNDRNVSKKHWHWSCKMWIVSETCWFNHDLTIF